MHGRRISRILVCATLAASCSKSPSSPSDPAALLRGQTVSAVDSTPVAGASVQVGAAYAVLSDGNGDFQVDIGATGTFPTNVTGSAIVQHRTQVTGPAGSSADRVRVSLIPLSFDLQAFDQMFRTANARLQRWTSQPALVVVATTMAYTQTSGFQFNTVDDRMTDDEVTQLISNMNDGLTTLTGGTYATFATVDVERPDVNQSVSVARTGKIVVGRYTGVKGFSDIIGYGTWQEQSDGTVTGGSMFLDRDFDRNDARRRLLRIHELGHALGYLHVFTRPSIMNPAIGPEPTDFDRQGSGIAFQRPPGNVDPDTDPGPVAHGSRYAGGRWAPLVP